jgi:hypothetical protein
MVCCSALFSEVCVFASFLFLFQGPRPTLGTDGFYYFSGPPKPSLLNWFRLAPECFHLCHFPGQLRSGYSPVLTITSDQASMMFAAANFLAYSCRLRMVWFPDINHIESNAEKAVFVAAAIQQINEKVSFLARLPYGPRKDAGHWHSQMKQAFEAPVLSPRSNHHSF